jgi:23S rRNA (uracil1939-C5)-methyltransferase
VRRVTVESLDAEGLGLASLDGDLVAVVGALPGELVEVHLPVSSRGEARLAKVVRSAPERVEPHCAHTVACGGCTWQHVAYPEQLRLKRERVQYLIDTALGGGTVRVQATVPTPCEAGQDAPWHFRRKVHFAFDSSADGRVVMGHLERRSHRVVDVDDCPVHAEAGNRVAREVRRVLADQGVACGPPPYGQVRHLVSRVARADDEVLATLVVTRHDAVVTRVTDAVLAGRDAPAGWAVNVHPHPGPMLLGQETIEVSGEGRIEERLAGARFRISATSFFQTNLAAADALLALVLEALPRAPARVLDLYAGVGLFAIPAALRGHDVLAIEESPVAVADGVESAALNAVEARCRFVRSKVEYGIARLKNKRPPYDVVVLDPPRTGASPAVLRRIREELAPERVVYVSCDPESLARDLQELAVRRGAWVYRVTKVRPVDMFPHTPHVETVAVLERV